MTSISEHVGFHFLSKPEEAQLNKLLCKHNSQETDGMTNFFSVSLNGLIMYFCGKQWQVERVEDPPQRPQRGRDQGAQELQGSSPAVIHEYIDQ